MDGVSVIIPVYNTQQHLRKTLDSCIGQSISKVEYILVDDGSTDDSGAICDEYAGRFEQVRAYHTKNSGVSAARNYGISVANFKYLMFVDADDYMEPNAIAKLYQTAESSGSDLAVCGYFMERLDREQKVVGRYSYRLTKDEVYSGREMLQSNYSKLWENSLLYNVWNKLFRSDIVRNKQLRFPDMKLGEDLAFICDYLKECNSIAVSSDCLYHYIRERDGAATAKFIRNWYEVRSEENRRLVDFFKTAGIYNEWGLQFLSKRFVERVLGCIENEFNRKNPKTKLEKKRTISRIISSEDVVQATRNTKSTSLVMKLMLVPIRLKSVRLTCLMGALTSFVRLHLPGLFLSLKVAR